METDKNISIEQQLAKLTKQLLPPTLKQTHGYYGIDTHHRLATGQIAKLFAPTPTRLRPPQEK